MQVPVLIERVEGNGYRARAGEPFGSRARRLSTDARAVNHQQTDQGEERTTHWGPLWKRTGWFQG